MNLHKLPIEVCVDIFAFFKRIELLNFESISLPIRNLINVHFGNGKAPFILLNTIFVKAAKFEVNIYWVNSTGKQRLQFASFQAALPWLCPPYIRAQTTSIFVFPLYKSPNFSTTIQSFLEGIKHCWQNGYLHIYQESESRVAAADEDEWTMAEINAFVKKTITQCLQLTIFWKIIPNGHLIIELMDVFGSVHMQLATFSSNFDKMMEWLESPRLGSPLSIVLNEPIDRRELLVSTLQTEYSHIEPILNAIKNRFLVSNSPSALPFLIEFTHLLVPDSLPQLATIFVAFNARTNEEMRCFRGDRYYVSIEIIRQLKEH